MADTTVDTKKAKMEPAKPKMTWADKMAALPEDERTAARAKAAEASRRSKAKKRGTSPEQAVVERLEAKLAKIDQQLAALKTEYADLMTRLKAAKATLAKAVKETPKAPEVNDEAG